MGAHMKTTIEISDTLLKEARTVVTRERTTLRKLMEEGLREVLKARRKKQHFRLRRASFAGKGLQPELRDASWERIRERAYEGHGA